jgi:hypothetical protein
VHDDHPFRPRTLTARAPCRDAPRTPAPIVQAYPPMAPVAGANRSGYLNRAAYCGFRLACPLGEGGAQPATGTAMTALATTAIDLAPTMRFGRTRMQPISVLSPFGDLIGSRRRCAAILRASMPALLPERARCPTQARIILETAVRRGGVCGGDGGAGQGAKTREWAFHCEEAQRRPAPPYPYSLRRSRLTKRVKHGVVQNALARIGLGDVRGGRLPLLESWCDLLAQSGADEAAGKA